MKILGMGNALVDVLAIIEDDNLLKNMGLPKGSMQLIDEDKLTEINTAIAGNEKFLASGGSASNTITGLARMGVEAGFLGKIGRDEYGRYFKEDLIRHGVVPHLTEDDAMSGIATTFISKDGERTFGTFLGAAALIAPEDLRKSDFEGYDFFYIEGYLVQNLDLIRRAIVLAKEAGLKIILDLASYNVVQANLQFLQEIVPQFVDILFANEEEALAFTGKEAGEAASVIGKDVEIAVVKEGSKGSWIVRGDEKTHVPALKVNCVDTTGAGDLYAAGFIYGLTLGKPLHNCGEYGTLLAGQVIQGIGAKIKDGDWMRLKASIN